MAHPGTNLPSIQSMSSLRLSEDMQKRMVEAQVRTAKAKLRNHIKSSDGAYTSDDCLPHINSLIDVDCQFSLKYEIIPIVKILSVCSQKDTLKRASDALNILEKYGKNLLRPSAKRPPFWRSVMFANGVFSDKVDWMVGGREILRHYGYVVEIQDGVAYPEHKEPDPNKVAMVTSDIMLAREEIQIYIEGRHPHPSSFEEYLPTTARVLQNLPHNAFDSICDTYIPESMKTSVSEPNLNAGSRLPPVIQQVPQTNRHDPFNGTVVEIPPAASTVLKSLIPETPPADGMKDCDICGQQQILFTCDVCDKKVLCKDCDEQWHKHPKRAYHQRKRADTNLNYPCPAKTESEKQGTPEPKQLPPSSSQFKPSEISEQGSGKSEIIRVIPGKGKDSVPRSQLPNLSIFNTNPLTSNSDELTSGGNKVDLEKEMAFHGIRMQSGPADPRYSVKTPKLNQAGGADGHLPILSVFERTLTNSATVHQSVDLKKEMEIHGIKLQKRDNMGDSSKEKFSHQDDMKSMVDEPPRVNIQDILKIPNFEQKRIKLEALVINTTSHMKQTEENLQLVIVHEPNFLDNDLYKELIKKKERLLRDLQIFESYRKMFEEEEKVRRLIQESQDEVLFNKSICLPPGDSFIPPTTRSSMRSKSVEDKNNSFVPSMLTSTIDPSFYEAPHSLPTVRPQQVYEISPWHIATNVLGVNAEYKGACPKCGNITNYYNDVCHHCKHEIPLNIKQEVLKIRSPMSMTPGKRSTSMEKIHPGSQLQTPAASSSVVPGIGAKPKVQSDIKPSHVPERRQKPVEKVKPTQTSACMKFGVYPKKWICQHCTFENDAMTRVCLICDRTSDKPQFVEENITDDDKLNSGSGEWGEVHSPRNVAVNFQQDAEQMALEKKKAREEFQKMMEEDEKNKSGRESRTVTDSPHIDKTVGVDDVDAGITDVRGNFITDREVSPQDIDIRNINLQNRGVSDEEKFKLQKELDEIASKKQQDEILGFSRETVKLIRLAENQGFTFDELTVALQKNGDNETALLWLQETWQSQIQEFMQKAVQCSEDSILSNVSESEARRALVETNCDIESAVSSCIQQRKEKIDEMCELTECTPELACESLHNTNGELDEALEFISMKLLQQVCDRMWTPSSRSAPSSLSSSQVQSSRSSSSSSSRAHQYNKLLPTTEAIVMDREIPFERRARIVLVEGKMQGWGRAENVLKVLELLPPEQDVNVNDVIDAVTNCGNIQDSLRYLLQECEVCYTQGPMSKMLSLPLCQCKICMDCLKSYFEVQVKEKHVRDMVCPVCEQPDVQDEGQADTHFTFISMLIQNFITPELNNLFLEKLRDWKLMQDPNFRWCSHCACGFIFNSEEGQLKMRCPDCNNHTCYECKKPWERAHEGLSCADFTVWKQLNDPEHQAAGLAKHLAENGIDCPQCNFRYALAKGGCMHFKCSQCRHEFCSGCYKPFKRGESCQLLGSCAQAGLHCHHPRDCLFYLRDFDVDKLQTLLTDKGVDFDTDASEGGEQGARTGCPVMEQKELPNGFKDEACGKEVPENYAGLCQLHYKEYLVSLINKNDIDPLDIMNTEELQIQCRRYEKNPPNKKRKESGEQYRNRLAQFIQREIRLPRRNGGQASS